MAEFAIEFSKSYSTSVETTRQLSRYYWTEEQNILPNEFWTLPGAVSSLESKSQQAPPAVYILAVSAHSRYNIYFNNFLPAIDQTKSFSLNTRFNSGLGSIQIPRAPKQIVIPAHTFVYFP